MAELNGNEIVEKAREYIGKVTYSFGSDDIENGRGDCSAFTNYIYNLFGVDIGQDSETQWTGKGTKVDKENLQLGDLVFFSNTYQNNHTDNVSHVGIYSGNGNFIDLGNSGVKEHSLDSEYYANHYLGAKRIDGVTATNEETTTSNVHNLKWYGDIIVYVLVAIMAIAGIVMLGLAVGINPVKIVKGGK